MCKVFLKNCFNFFYIGAFLHFFNICFNISTIYVKYTLCTYIVWHACLKMSMHADMALTFAINLKN